MSNVSVAANTNFEVFSIPVYALVTKTENGVKFLVMPGKPSGECTVSFEEFLKSVENTAKTTIDRNGIEEVLNVVGLNLQTKLNFHQIFFYYDSSLPDSMEYAFSVSLETKPTKQLDIFEINSLGFAIWNTKRESVIKTMNLKDIAACLEEIK